MLKVFHIITIASLLFLGIQLGLTQEKESVTIPTESATSTQILDAPITHIKLTIETMQTIIQVLDQLPYGQIAQLRNKINEEIQPQIQPQSK